MFQKKRIDEWALDYWLLQRYAKLCYRFYYRSISVINRENLPANQPVILAPNHQNALMDALALVCNTELQTVFLARADIFKGKLLVRLLTFLNIMPVYRIRDGYENVKKNDEVFNKTTEVLENKLNPLCLFPEGNHGDKRRLRSLVKGLFRIAFIAQEGYGKKPGIKIIPVGIDYSHYTHFRADVFVNFGKPIEVSEYWNAYQDNPVQGINQLKERYAAEVSRLIIDIRTEEFYDSYMALRTIYNEDMRRGLGITGMAPADRFRADKEMIRRLDRAQEKHPHKIKELDTRVRNYQELLETFRLRDWVVRKPVDSAISLLMAGLLKILLLPVFLVGAFNNYLPYWFTAGRVRKIKDPQFHSSFKFVIGMLAFPAWYIPILLLVWMLPFPLWFSGAYTVLLPATGLWAFRYAMSVKKLMARIRYTSAVKKRNPEALRMQDLRREIISSMQEITASTKENHEDKG